MSEQKEKESKGIKKIKIPVPISLDLQNEWMTPHVLEYAGISSGKVVEINRVSGKSIALVEIVVQP